MRHPIRTPLLGLISVFAVLLGTLGGATTPSALATELPPIPQVAELAPVTTTTTLSPLMIPTEYGNSLLFTATVTPDGPSNLIGQTVELWLNGTLAGGGVLLYTGEGHFSGLVVTTALPNAGDYTAVIKFPGLDAAQTETRGALPSESSPFTFSVAPLSSTTAVVTAPTTAAAFSPIDVNATVHATDHTPTGTATLMLNDQALATTDLHPTGDTPGESTATFTQVRLPATGTELWVRYNGSPDENFSPSASERAQIEISALSTRTEIALNPTHLRADEVTDVEITVTNETAGSTHDPVGSIQIVVDGEIAVTVTEAQDEDPQLHNGVSRYTVPLSGAGLTPGAHIISANFVPEAGYSASQSDERTLVVSAIPTAVSASASRYTGTVAHPPVIRVSVDSSETPDGEVRRAVPVTATGSVQAFAGDQALGAPVRLDDRSALVRLTGLGVGTHDIELRFTPDAHLSMLSSSTSVVAVISADAQPDPQPPTDDASNASTPEGPSALAHTGGASVPVGVLGVAALGVLLGAVLLRRTV